MLNAGNLLANGTAPAPEPVSEGVEISGNVDTIAAFGLDSSNSTAGFPAGISDIAGMAAGGGSAKEFRFVVDQAEIDLAKSFGENIRLRADVDVTDFANTAHRTGVMVDLEQAYVTANIAAGNGIEFLIGKFNAPVGVDSVDRNNNWLVTYSPNFRYLTPSNVIGAKIYYAFSDLVDLHFGVVNNLNTIGFGDSSYPSALFRLGFNWGDEGNESTLGISGGIGPEAGTGAGVADGFSNLDYFGDLDAMVALSDTWNLALEGTYRVSDDGVAGGNGSALAGFLAINYEASDVWDLTLRATIHDELSTGNGVSTNGSGTFNGAGYKGMDLGGSFGAGYAIADGAKMKMEYRFDMNSTSGAAANPTHHAALAEFAYTF
ncbi:MAG: outer membrane beta-barrel protein [Deltaproteobacteria bacterium]|nr:outer membrane beta-barrel protein [Deltaproteobacteria bacterium]